MTLDEILSKITEPNEDILKENEIDEIVHASERLNFKESYSDGNKYNVKKSKKYHSDNEDSDNIYEPMLKEAITKIYKISVKRKDG